MQGADGVHFEAAVVSAAFAGKLPLARHRMVYATLGDLMGGAIHALSLQTLHARGSVARRLMRRTAAFALKESRWRRS